MTDEEATDPNRWARHIRSTVRFADELHTLLEDPHPGAGRGGRVATDRFGIAAFRVVRKPTVQFMMRHGADALFVRVYRTGQVWRSRVSGRLAFELDIIR